MRLIPCPPAEIRGGEVLLDGVDLLKLGDDEISATRGRQIAMIFQEPMRSLNPVLTIGRQMTEAMRFHLGLDRKEARQRAIELLKRVRISDAEHRLKQYPHHYSGGMSQRIMIAMAVACEPRVILADEPTTALDVTVQAQVLELISDLCSSLGMAMVMITHNLSLIARHADRVAVMYAGRIVEEASTKELFSNPRHPYTVGLIRSVPRLDVACKFRLDPIEGNTPDLSRLPIGCAFRRRCQFAVERCAVETPPLLELGNGHVSACWEAERVGISVTPRIKAGQ